MSGTTIQVQAAFIFILCAAGCATTTLTPVEQSYLEEVQRFTEATGRAYNRPVPHVTAGPANNQNQGGGFRRGYLYITPTMLGSQHRDALVAHELAHWLLNHDTALNRSFQRALTVSDWSRLVQPLEIDANAKAVEILVRVRWYQEVTSLRLVYLHLQASHRHGMQLLGHASPCEEITDLLLRFPQHRSITRSWTCAPTGA